MQNAECRMQNCAYRLFNGEIVPAERTFLMNNEK